MFRFLLKAFLFVLFSSLFWIAVFMWTVQGIEKTPVDVSSNVIFEYSIFEDTSTRRNF